MAAMFTVFIILTTVITVKSQDFEIKECMSGKEEPVPQIIKFQCPPNTKIRVEEAIYGRNKWSSLASCSQTVGDCSEKIDLFDNCQDEQQCSVLLTKTYSAKCGGYATFLRVLYDCIPDVTILTVTQANPLTSSKETRFWSPPIAIRDNSKLPEDITGSDDVGLIAGCVVAVVITVIMLLFAIYLVVKRLFKPSPTDEEKGPDGNPQHKPDIVIFDIVCCCFRSAKPEKHRPVVDQNQNTQTAPRISDRPVPIGEVTTPNVNEFGQTIDTTDNTRSSVIVIQSHTPSVAAEIIQNPNNHEQSVRNSAVGLPNTRSSTAC